MFFLCFFCGMNCFFCFFCGMIFFFLLCFYLWYELCFFLCFFLWYELLLFLCFFLWYELFVFRAFFCAFFLCSGAPEKHKKKHKNISISLEKMNLRPPALDSFRTSGPANVSHHFLFPTSFPKKTLRSEPMPGAGM